MRVRVWGKADEYPYKCTTLSLSYRMVIIYDHLRTLGRPGRGVVARQTMAADGVRGFYRGLVPNMLKVLPATGISYCVFSVVSARVQAGGE